MTTIENTMTSIPSKMSDLKEQVINFKTKIFGHCPADPRHLGIHLLTKVIPSMDGNGDVAFAWAWAKNDVCVYNQED